MKNDEECARNYTSICSSLPLWLLTLRERTIEITKHSVDIVILLSLIVNKPNENCCQNLWYATKSHYMIYNYKGFLQHKRKNLTANFQLGCIYTERKGTFSLIFAVTQ